MLLVFGRESKQTYCMSNAEIDQYFEYHNQNMKLLQIGFTRIKKEINNTYRLKDGSNYVFELSVNDPRRKEAQDTINSYNRILSGIQISWAEESIKRLWYEKSVFADDQSNFLIDNRVLEQRWHLTLKLSYCIAYNLVPQGDETCQSVNINRDSRHLGSIVTTKYRSLKQIVNEILVPGFHIRNKVQHGEWIAAFLPPDSKVYSQDLSDKISAEDVVRISSRYLITTSLYNLIVEIVRFRSRNFALDPSQTPFEYFFDQRKRKIEFERKKVLDSSLDKYVNHLIKSEKKADMYRASLLSDE